MKNGWQESANAWIADMGEHGDFGRRYVLDPVMLPRALRGSPESVLDIGCGEGRFCRMLRQNGVAHVTGIDPTPALIEAARIRDPLSTYIEAGAEELPFAAESFDLAISYLSLLDIPDLDVAIPEMARVIKPGGRLLIANLNSFKSACGDEGWVMGANGERLHYPVDNYLSERRMWSEYRGIRVANYHRPLSTYMRLLLGAGLQLVHFDEPAPIEGAPKRAEYFLRVPWYLVMEWVKPVSPDAAP